MKPLRLNRDSGRNRVNIILLLLCISILVLTAVLAPTARYYMQRADARAVLTEAKSAKMAAYVTALEHETEGSPFQDQSQPYGFAKGVEEEVVELAGCPGEVYLQQYDAAKIEFYKLLYIEGAYTVTYSQDEEGEHWNVYYSKHIIQH